mmetsp:Transcript_108331/g.170856  ORF Transcript_108331/g.170856 Transcript_108331/m.170856 type:complete len:796 (-) Transcript_108331:251-2638(-)|eukprot:CAMPEP_0169083856 /NCGR_PEP_ID=MMETSP1015-20121227/12301_1 /TAXON_ID=342587 /ORGANISM="Karlodinium micrum, Strain CCMP2283" /LENGTH=795 /DNA_ID=CAMNT_0009143807 /DNA_START=58 /DNA_END=2442 /DNA_ORIENTATION=+
MAMLPEAESCLSLATELRHLLLEVDKKWRSLEACLEDTEESTLQCHSADLQKWFGSGISKSLEDWGCGGLRRRTRERVQKLLLGPLTERLRGICIVPAQRTETSSPTQEAATELASHPIDELLEQWEANVQQKLDLTTKQDGRHGRKIARLEKVHACTDIKLEQQKRFALWLEMQSTLATVEVPLRALAEFVATALSDEAVARFAAAVPAIVARSVCDWHFQRCMAEFTQLSSWWQGARAAFQRRPKLWQRLLETDALFVNRIDHGIEEIEGEKQLYMSLANFGHSGATLTAANGAWPADAVLLLANAVKEMRRRLRPIRDAAAWHVIDSAKAIQKELLKEEKCKEGSPWEQLTEEEGMAIFCQVLDVKAQANHGTWKSHLAASFTFDHLDPMDAALQFSNVLDKLAGVIADIGKFVDDEGLPDAGGLSYILEEVLQGISYVHEDLLVVLDDATRDNLLDWLRAWGKWGDAQAGARLGAAMAAMPMQADSSLRHERRQGRRSKLAMIRGLQSLLEDGRFRAFLLYCAVAPPSDTSALDEGTCPNMHEVVAKSDVLEIVDLEFLSCNESQAPASPRSCYVSRKPCSQHFEEPILVETEEQSCREHERKPASKQCDKIAPSPKIDEADTAVTMSCSEIGSQEIAVKNTISSLDEVTEEIASHPGVVPFRPKSQPDIVKRPSRKKDKGNAESTSAASNAPHGGITALPPTPGRAGTPARPVTPSWLEPPWPRSAQEVPFNSWTRPGTPSTVCDEADLVLNTITPKSKFVDGHCIALRPTSSCKRLPPLNSPPLGKNAW